MHFHGAQQNFKSASLLFEEQQHSLSLIVKNNCQSQPYEFTHDEKCIYVTMHCQIHRCLEAFLPFGSAARNDTSAKLYNFVLSSLFDFVPVRTGNHSFYVKAHARSIQYMRGTEQHYYPSHCNTNTSSLPRCHFLSFKRIQRKCQSF